MAGGIGSGGATDLLGWTKLLGTCANKTPYPALTVEVGNSIAVWFS